METITYQNITIDGAPYTRLLEVNISHQINNHGQAFISGEVDGEAGTEFVKRVDETMFITLRTTASGQPSVLFCGVVSDVGLSQEKDYTRVCLIIGSMHKMTDFFVLQGKISTA